MSPVHGPSLKCLQGELNTGPDRTCFLNGREYYTWGKKKEYDLISLSDRYKNSDTLSSWLEWWVTDIWHKYCGHKRPARIAVDTDWAPAVPSRLVHYSDSSIASSVTGIITILAALLPTASASALFFIRDQPTRLGLTVLLSFTFSSLLALVGSPRRIDAFVATSTFAALLIVFLSNNTGCDC